ncbi:LptF/LptG family permease [Pseudoruegeria sp. HB172150]|uniref:LptF/LptG family permease n=1 Tax=Pseudoruegeria sp. HB172150 TaxID=2721164 RepID=UPI0015541E8D|nr:LptF/LptG family permease [Pseudoruegeria sp. HB172150]
MRGRPAVFALATRRAAAEYLAGVLLILFILLMIAYTIDLAGNFPKLRTAAQRQGVFLPTLLFPYLGQRGVDIVTRMLPMATFFGVFLIEIFRRMRLESVMLAAAGATPARGFAALLWVALVLGSVHWALETRWRPAAIWAQVETGFGSYAQRFPRTWRDNTWLVAGDTAIRADILRDSDAQMRNAVIFHGIRDDQLQAIDGAARILPTATPLVWQMEGVTRWEPGNAGTGAAPLSAPDGTLDLALIPEQLQYHDVPGFYLPNGPLHAIAAMPDPPENIADIETAIWRRRVAWFLPGVVALLAAGLAHLGFEGRRVLIPHQIAFAAAGYGYTAAIKTFWSLGELGTLSAPVALLTPLLAGLAVAVLLIRRAT